MNSSLDRLVKGPLASPKAKKASNPSASGIRNAELRTAEPEGGDLDNIEPTQVEPCEIQPGKFKATERKAKDIDIMKPIPELEGGNTWPQKALCSTCTNLSWLFLTRAQRVDLLLGNPRSNAARSPAGLRHWERYDSQAGLVELYSPTAQSSKLYKRINKPECHWRISKDVPIYVISIAGISRSRETCDFCAFIYFCCTEHTKWKKEPAIITIETIWASQNFSTGLRVSNFDYDILRVYCEAEDINASRVQGRPVAKKGGDLSVLQAAQSWVEDCYHNHPECKWSDDDKQSSESDPMLPARIIDIGESDAQLPRLVLSYGRKGKWAALSHRWPRGKENFLRLLTENITIMESGISRDTLAASFRDALIITRALGLRYLWIDSLCILQDSPQDWEVQSSQMPNIYKNAFLTIAAGATEDCLGGILGERDWVPASRPLKLMVENEDIPGLVFIDFCLDGALNQNPGTRNTVVNYLSHRAWCFQQSLLSRRLLTFDRIQVSFTCLRHGLFEDRYLLPAEAKEYRNEFIPAFREPLLDDASTLHSALKSWYKVLADYTNRSLTFPTDKLVAISGVAKVVGTFLNDEYYAGLWPQSLLWSPYDEEDLPNPGYVATRPSEYRAPTWSWAAAESRISNFLCHILLSEPALATVVDISTEFGGTDQYGQVKSGKLTIRGPFRKAYCGFKLSSWPSQPQLCWSPSSPEDHDNIDISHCVFDYESPPVGSALWCLRITRQYGLILAPYPDHQSVTGDFVRIGIFHLRLRDVDNWRVPEIFAENDVATINIF